MKRKVLVLFMALLLLIPMTFTAAANNYVQITSEDVHGNVGDTVTAVLQIAIETPKLGQTMDSLQFDLEYDRAALEFVDIQEVSGEYITILGARYLCNVTEREGGFAFAAAATGGATGSGTLMRVRFKILSAASTMLVLKKVSYSFVTTSSGSQRAYTGGAMNLGRITGQTALVTLPPASSSASPWETAAPAPEDTAAPQQYPVAEISFEPGVSPTPAPSSAESDILAYIVFGLFIIVAILICVVLTLMIVRRRRSRLNQELLEDDDEDDRAYDEEEDEDLREEEPYEEEAYDDYEQEEEPDDEPPIKIVRRTRK